MKEISKFANVAGTPSGLFNALDSVGSSQDKVFAEAIIAYETPTVLEEAGIITVRQVADPTDTISFPIVRNTRLTWATIDGRSATGSGLGSEFNAQALNRVEYMEVRPVVKTANLFLPDQVSLLNKVDFSLHAEMAARDAKRQKESDALTTLTTEASLTNKYGAGAFVLNGSILAGSTLGPSDLLAAQRVLAVGSDPITPDFVLVHNIQYEHLNKHANFAPGATTPGAMMRKAQFDADGNIVRFSGMDIYVSPLMPAVTGSATTAYPVSGHPAIVGKKGWAIGRGEKQGISVNTVDDRVRHGQYKVIDMAYANTVLVAESIVLIKCADA